MAANENTQVANQKPLPSKGDDYIYAVVDPQQKYFSNKASENKKKFYWIQILILCCGAAIPLTVVAELIWFTECKNFSEILSTFFAVAITILTGLDKLKQYQFEWINNRKTSERLKRERNYYAMKSGPYNDCEATELEKLLVVRVEGIISDDVDNFVKQKESIQKPSDEKIDNINKNKE